MSSANPLSLVSRVVLPLMLLGLLLLLGYTIAYQVKNPGLTQQATQQRGGQEQAQDPEQTQEMMDMVSALMQRVQEDPQDLEALEQLGLIFMRMEAWDRAAKFWKRLLEQEPEHGQARQQLANCYFRQEEYAQAAMELQRVLEQEPEAPHANFNLGLLYAYYLQDEDQAQEHFQNVLDSPAAEGQLQEQAREEMQNLQQ
ncbi:MAG: tetratricopeptide repeat protein [Thermodesulfobacteriota bacterium]